VENHTTLEKGLQNLVDSSMLIWISLGCRLPLCRFILDSKKLCYFSLNNFAWIIASNLLHIIFFVAFFPYKLIVPLILVSVWSHEMIGKNQETISQPVLLDEVKRIPHFSHIPSFKFDLHHKDR
jgi:hypothetical protein